MGKTRKSTKFLSDSTSCYSRLSYVRRVSAFEISIFLSQRLSHGVIRKVESPFTFNLLSRLNHPATLVTANI